MKCQKQVLGDVFRVISIFFCKHLWRASDCFFWLMPYIYRIGIRRNDSNFKFLATGVAIWKFENHYKIENSSCFKIHGVGIQNDRIRTTITTQQTKKYLSLSAWENVRKLFIPVQLIIMPNSWGFYSISRPSKLRSFFRLLNTHIRYFQATWILSFVKVFQIFKLRPW